MRVNVILKTVLKSLHVYFLPTAIYPNWGQSQRADLISKADYIQNQDVVILNELFDKKLQIDC